MNGKHDFLGKRRERERERDVEVTILVPRPHLPERIPHPLPVWGGGLVGGAKHRVYTDDSPIVLCALHAGFVTWSEVCTARDQRPGRDLKVRVRIRREGAGARGEWSGGPSAAGDALAGVGISGGKPGGNRKGKERERTDESVGLVSRAWSAPHDGSGVEVLAVEWIPVCVRSFSFPHLSTGLIRSQPRTAHALHFPNRRARLAEYAERRQELMAAYDGADAGQVGQKRQRKLPNAIALHPILEEPEEQLQTRSLVWGRAGADVGCVAISSTFSSAQELILLSYLFTDSNSIRMSCARCSSQILRRKRPMASAHTGPGSGAEQIHGRILRRPRDRMGRKAPQITER